MASEETKESGKVKTIRGFILPCVSVIAVLGGAVILYVLWSYATYRDIQSGWLRLSGYSLIVEQHQIDLGEVLAGESKSGTFRLRNLTGEPVYILGLQSDCSCLATAALPIAIPSGDWFDFEVLFQADRVDSNTGVTRRIILNLSVDQPIQLLEFKATIIPNHKEKQDDS